MPSVAEQLREAREHAALSVDDVADETKIRTDHIRALEKGDFAAFPAPVYVRGFVKNYASLVKLDVPRILEQLDRELGTPRKPQNTAAKAPKASEWTMDSVLLSVSKLNWRTAAWIIGGVVILVALIAGYRSWRNFVQTDPLSDLGPGIYRPHDSDSGSGGSGEILPLPSE